MADRQETEQTAPREEVEEGIRRQQTGEAVVEEDYRRPSDRLAALVGDRMYRMAGLLFLLALFLLYFEPISRVLLIAFVGAILGVAYNAIVVRMPFRRGISVAILALLTLGSIGALFWFGISFLVAQVRELIDNLPTILASVEEWVQDVTGTDLELMGPRVQQIVNELFGGIEGGAVIAGAFGVFELLAIALLVLLGAFFVVAKPNEQLLNPLLRAVPHESRPAFRRMFERLGERLAGWLWGTLISMLIIGALAVIVFYFLDVPYWLLLGVIVGLTDIIPLVGPWIGGLVAVIVTLFHDPSLALWVAIAVIAIQEVEGNLIRPLVMSESVALHPFVTLLALLLFSSIFGLIGAILALPLVLVIVTIVEVFWVEETLGAGEEEVEPLVEE